MCTLSKVIGIACLIDVRYKKTGSVKKNNSTNDVTLFERFYKVTKIPS